MYLTKSLYWFTWDCIFILERLLAWCQESSLLPSLPWNTTHRCKGSWQLPGCPARSPSSPTTWSCCPSQNHTCSSMSSPLTARRYPKSWKGAVSAPAPHRGGYGEGGGTGGDFGGCFSHPWPFWGCEVPLLEQACQDDGWPLVQGQLAAGEPPRVAAALQTRSRATMDREGAPHQPKEQHALYKPNGSTETLCLGGRCTKWPWKRTGVLLSPETTLNDPIALVV